MLATSQKGGAYRGKFAEPVGALPGTHWIWSGEMIDGKKVTNLVDDVTGEIIGPKQIEERLNQYKKLVNRDEITVQLMMLEQRIKLAVKEAKEEAMRYHEVEKKSEKETDEYFSEIWEQTVEPLIEQARLLGRDMMEKHGVEVPLEEEGEEEDLPVETRGES